MSDFFGPTNGVISTKTYTAPDNAYVDLFSVDLATANTGCFICTVMQYNITNGAAAGNHVGVYTWSFVNDGGVVSGTGSDAGEANSGSGGGAGIDTQNVSVVGTVATAQIKYNNTFSVAGTITMKILASTSQHLTIL